MQDWIGKQVAVCTVEETFTAKLVDTTPQGVVVEMNFSNDGEPPFETLTTDTEVLLFIPLFRLKGISTASYQGIR